MLETTFDKNGAILKQQLLALDGKQLEERIKQELISASVQKTKERPFEEIKLNKKCPNCGSSSLTRCAKSVLGSEAPVMPLYLCSSCNTRSYHLTTTYLEYLVKNNPDLFAKEELSEFEKGNDAFISELQGYILRIFASKKIISIK